MKFTITEDEKNHIRWMHTEAVRTQYGIIKEQTSGTPLPPNVRDELIRRTETGNDYEGFLPNDPNLFYYKFSNRGNFSVRLDIYKPIYFLNGLGFSIATIGNVFIRQSTGTNQKPEGVIESIYQIDPPQKISDQVMPEEINTRSIVNYINHYESKDPRFAQMIQKMRENSKSIKKQLPQGKVMEVYKALNIIQ